MSYGYGFFGVPGSVATGKTHIVDNDGKRPVCGARFPRAAEYQFCANFIRLDGVECKRCRTWYAINRT